MPIDHQEAKRVAMQLADMEYKTYEAILLQSQKVAMAYLDLRNSSSGPSMPALITAEQLAEVKDQCEAGLQVEHECPAMFALAAIYAELFVDSGTPATVEKE